MQPATFTLTQTEKSLPQFLRFTSDAPNEQPDIQPVIDRLRIIYLQHIDCDDELSLKIHEVAEKFILEDCSKISQLSDLVKIAQDCKKQFAKVLCSDFDQAPLAVPIVIRGWKVDQWQMLDYSNLDKYFGQRPVAISPFDQLPLPEELPKHELAQDIIDLLKTIPEFLQEANGPSELVMTTGVLSQQDAANFAPENNFFVAWQRYVMWKKLAQSSVQEKKCKAIIDDLKIDIAARKQANEDHLHEIISQEAQRMLAYFEERQQATQVQINEAEQARIEIVNLKTQLDESRRNLKQLRADLAAQEKCSVDLQQQISVEQGKYTKLAQEIQQIHNENEGKRKPWWKRIF
jgi:hypothetical protein